MSKNKITSIILERVGNLLLEGRLEDVKEKYPYPMWGEVDRLASKDPSGNQKYLEWLAKNMLTKTIKWFKDNAGNGSSWYSWNLSDVPDKAVDPGWEQISSIRRNFSTIDNSDLLKVADDIEYFHKNPTKYEKKDINQFVNLSELENATNEAKLKLSRKEQKETGVDKVFEDDNFLLLMPKTHKASCRYGSNTKWCVTMRGTSNYFENYFGQGPIFFLIDKRKLEPTSSMDTPNYYKIAMHYRPFNAALDGSGRTALEYAKKKSKEDFVNGANSENTIIDYWNVADDKKPEKLVLKYLGGPGRGQTKNGTESLEKLKDVMQTYTRKILSDYYDSLGDISEIVAKIVVKRRELDELETKDNVIYNKLNRLENVNTSLIQYLDRLESYRGGDDEEIFSWVEEQHKKSENFLNLYRAKRLESKQLLLIKRSEVDKLEGEIKNKGLVFYDKEKNESLR